MAFEAAAEGKSDREVAESRSRHGYRTTRNRGRNPFTKDSVRGLLQNRFYLGELPITELRQGKGERKQYVTTGWMLGKHAAMLDADLFDRVQAARLANRRNRAPVSVRPGATTYALSGLMRCSRCGGPVHIERGRTGQPAVYCYHRRQGRGCEQRSVPATVLETQLAEYLETFYLPEHVVEHVIVLHAQDGETIVDTNAMCRSVENRLTRLTDLYELGDIDRGEYLRKREALKAKLAAIKPAVDRSETLRETARPLRDLSAAWDAATGEQRNRLANLLFEGMRLNDNRVESVCPRPEFRPFFVLDYVHRLNDGIERKRRDSNPRSQP